VREAVPPLGKLGLAVSFLYVSSMRSARWFRHSKKSRVLAPAPAPPTVSVTCPRQSGAGSGGRLRTARP
jgi:hypothetical protein